MKKIVTIICVISIILTTVVFSVSAAEIGFDATQNESPIAEKEENEVVPEEDIVAPVEKIIEEDTVAFVEETTEAETVKGQKIDLTDGTHGYADENYNPIWTVDWTNVPYEDLPPELQAWWDEQEAEEARRLAELAPRPLTEEEKAKANNPFNAMRIRDDIRQKCVTIEHYRQAQEIILEELADVAVKQNAEAIQISVNEEGKLTSDTEFVVSEETLIKLATLYYDAFDDWNVSLDWHYFSDMKLQLYEYYAEEGYWFFYFSHDLDYKMALERELGYNARGGQWVIVLKENGELYCVGE